MMALGSLGEPQPWPDEIDCDAGLLTQLSGGDCGVHPSYAGQCLLALAVERAL
jgi:hypothetical protein